MFNLNPDRAKADRSKTRSAAAQTSESQQALAQHEELCTRCGKCCYKKIIVGKMVHITPFPCEFLDTQTNQCTIYARRHELNPDCLDVQEALKHGALPADCGYLPSLATPDYLPALDTWNWEGQWFDFDPLADELDVSDATREKLRQRGPFAPPLWVDATPFQAPSHTGCSAKEAQA